jgi:virginiamycin B lyase
LTTRTLAPSSSIIIIIIIIILFLAIPHIYAQQAGITIKEWEVPTSNSAPHDIIVDERNGIVWFTEYNAAKIGSFDPKTNEFKEYETTTPGSGPYAIWVDIFDNVWFSMTGAFKVGKLDQSTNTIQEYELPTPRTIIRFIYADNSGNIWFPNNNNNKIGMIAQSMY